MTFITWFRKLIIKSLTIESSIKFESASYKDEPTQTNFKIKNKF